MEARQEGPPDSTTIGLLSVSLIDKLYVYMCDLFSSL